MQRDALRRRAIVAQNRLFFYSERRHTTCRSRRRCHAKLYRHAGKFWHDVASRRGALRQLASYCELGFRRSFLLWAPAHNYFSTTKLQLLNFRASVFPSHYVREKNWPGDEATSQTAMFSVKLKHLPKH